MKKKLFFYCIIFFGFVGFISAQRQVFNASHRWEWGIKAGVNYDWVSNMQDGVSKLGFRLGAKVEKHLAFNCYFQSSWMFTSRGFSFSQKNYLEGYFQAYFLEINGLFLFKFGNSKKKEGFFLGGGPYFAYGLLGNSKITDLRASSANHNPEYFKTFGRHPNALTKWDIGFHAGVGYDFNTHWQIAVYYNLGLNRVKGETNWQWRGGHAVLVYSF